MSDDSDSRMITSATNASTCRDTRHNSSRDVGLPRSESAQLRNEDAVNRHICLSCLAQSFLQTATAAGATSEKFSFASTTPSIGQKLYGLARQALHPLVQLCQSLFAQGQSVAQVVEVIMPA